jgi:hypothetical protein
MHTDVVLGLGYLQLAYLAAALILAWDYLAPRLRLSRVRRAIVQRAKRDAARSASTNPQSRIQNPENP